MPPAFWNAPASKEVGQSD